MRTVDLQDLLGGSVLLRVLRAVSAFRGVSGADLAVQYLQPTHCRCFFLYSVPPSSPCLHASKMSRYNDGYGQQPYQAPTNDPQTRGWDYTGHNSNSRVAFYENPQGVKMDYYYTTARSFSAATSPPTRSGRCRTTRASTRARATTPSRSDAEGWEAAGGVAGTISPIKALAQVEGGRLRFAGRARSLLVVRWLSNLVVTMYHIVQGNRLLSFANIPGLAGMFGRGVWQGDIMILDVTRQGSTPLERLLSQRWPPHTGAHPQEPGGSVTMDVLLADSPRRTVAQRSLPASACCCWWLAICARSAAACWVAALSCEAVKGAAAAGPAAAAPDCITAPTLDVLE
ncbi:hypothetical protein TSOC_010815 [Tetrabaena socialis]|uniref:Uncharacterized protein n=1 Tax=Tetrabaena socialis TaxID=47790 RepID=A0A2J7ZSA8_9CHLO|nr:hypothetical protein TSOC_010815 [Tetrabaena socialis]|eukprot:PNH03159.1 hypothetical protein TSOC_010815 [Tetrabaena socialis]